MKTICNQSIASLGVKFHHLLSGDHPASEEAQTQSVVGHGGELDELRAVVEDGQLAPRVAGDLDDEQVCLVRHVVDLDKRLDITVLSLPVLEDPIVHGRLEVVAAVLLPQLVEVAIADRIGEVGFCDRGCQAVFDLGDLVVQGQVVGLMEDWNKKRESSAPIAN